MAGYYLLQLTPSKVSSNFFKRKRTKSTGFAIGVNSCLTSVTFDFKPPLILSLKLYHQYEREKCGSGKKKRSSAA